MHLLVTTSQSLLLIDTDNGNITPIDRGHGLYYGIACDGEQLYVAVRNRPVSSGTEQADERGEIMIFNRQLQACGSLQSPFPLRDLHEIAWHQGRLWASCSHDNMIAIYDGTQWEQWFPLGGGPLGENLESPGDINHFNSFRFENDKVWVLAHNRGKSELLAFAIDSRTLIERIELGSHAHNIWREDEQIFTCSSMDGRIVGNQGFALETGGFPRGVTCTPELRCVGISAMAERKARDFTTGKIMFFKPDWSLIKELILQDEGLILDILPLPQGFALQAALPPAFVAPPSGDMFYRAYEDRNRGSRELIKSRLAGYRPFLKPLIALYPKGEAIDLGCGRGEWLETLKETGFNASGVDLDEGMLEGCRRLGLNARHADALQTLRDLPDESVALVSAFHVVEHIPFDLVRTLIREACRVLKPGGLLILETPNPENVVVGSSLFYQDPTHIRPLPPELLNFAVEFEGFPRKIIARLQESPSLHTNAHIPLVSILEGVSPDYAVIGQKAATPAILFPFEPAFKASYGITLSTLAHRFETQEQRRMTNLVIDSHAGVDRKIADFNERIAATERRLHEADQRFAELTYHNDQLREHLHQVNQANHANQMLVIQHAQLAQDLTQQLMAMQNSHSWKITAPLRWLTNQIRLVRQHGLMSRIKAMLRKISGAPPVPQDSTDTAQAPVVNAPAEEATPAPVTATSAEAPANTSAMTIEAAPDNIAPQTRTIYQQIKTENDHHHGRL